MTLKPREMPAVDAVTPPKVAYIPDIEFDATSLRTVDGRLEVSRQIKYIVAHAVYIAKVFSTRYPATFEKIKDIIAAHIHARFTAAIERNGEPNDTGEIEIGSSFAKGVAKSLTKDLISEYLGSDAVSDSSDVALVEYNAEIRIAAVIPAIIALNYVGVIRIVDTALVNPEITYTPDEYVIRIKLPAILKNGFFDNLHYYGKLKNDR